jgi:hypothetical protein
MREAVLVDFDAELDELAGQTSDRFSAIRPRVICDGYRDYWNIDGLLETVRRVRSEHPTKGVTASARW